METNTLCCTVRLEWTNGQGVVTRKVNYKSGSSKVVRNELKKMFVEVSTEKSAPVRLELKKGISVHKNFMKEGKASIKFPDIYCTLFYSNAPPGQLQMFLRNIFVKMTGGKEMPNANTSLRTQLLSNKKINQFEEISPVTTIELNKACAKISRNTDTTPSPSSRKRKLSSENGMVINNTKRPCAPSPILDEPLNIEQKEVLEACLAGYNVFFTGSAGTGKSYLLRKIISSLPPNVTMATASTGVAACHIGGTTLHQFAGIGYGAAPLDRSYQMASKPAVAQIWRKCKHLIIDEISMVDGNYFEKIEAVARYVRKNDKPFGGIQLIVCGDFFQLPPVFKQKENFNKKNENSARFCFQTPVWERCIQVMFELKQIHRQNDCNFIEILNNIRLGHIPEEMANKLMATSKQKIEQNGILATRLCSHTQDADIINESKLKSLPGELKVYEAQDSDKYFTKQMDQQTSVPGRLELKIGAQVMLLKNINIASGLVNGARGVVKDFRDGLPVVTFRNNREFLAKHQRWTIKTANGATLIRKQVPLRLAWAFSIHKSQGLTLDCVEMSLSRVFEAGQAYVALSRAQSLETLRVLDFKTSQVWANPDVLSFYKKLRERISLTEMIPLGKRADKNIVKKGKLKPSLSKKLFSGPLVSIA